MSRSPALAAAWRWSLDCYGLRSCPLTAAVVLPMGQVPRCTCVWCARHQLPPSSSRRVSPALSLLSTARVWPAPNLAEAISKALITA